MVDAATIGQVPDPVVVLVGASAVGQIPGPDGGRRYLDLDVRDGGVVRCGADGDELAASTVTATYGAPVDYRLFLTPRKTADSSDGPTIEETLQMRYRP